MFKLDFSLTTAEERNQYIQSNNLSALTPKQLELCANYILYGKDKTGKSEVDKKNIYINTKYNSYAQRRPESLDSLMENPNFDEGILTRVNKHNKIVKPTIDRKKDADIPTIQDMWENIDQLQHLLDANTGKIDDPTAKKLTDTQIYRLRHGLIDIRRGQYYLKDIFKPTIGKAVNKLEYIPMPHENEIIWNEPDGRYGFAPLGLIDDNGLGKQVFENVREVGYCPDLYNRKAEKIIDFRNPNHIYQLFEHYEDLLCGATHPDNLFGNIARTLDWYIGQANLREQHYIIIAMKKKKCTNKQINKVLTEKCGTTHSENYISTIWTQKICKEIATAAKLHYEAFLARDDDGAWKKCNVCGAIKLRTNAYFVKKNHTGDGLSGRCKCCDRIYRLRRKEKLKEWNCSENASVAEKTSPSENLGA